jgi:acetolactate synthase-1/2/3 large subunit
MWHVPAKRIAAADTRVAVGQLADFVRDNALADPAAVAARRAEVTVAGQARRAALDQLERPQPGVITPRYLTACVRDLLAAPTRWY